MSIAGRLIPIDWRPFRVAANIGAPVIFDARVAGLKSVVELDPAVTVERAERIAQWLNDCARADEARALLDEWTSTLGAHQDALAHQLSGYDGGEHWASPIASTYRQIARVSEEVSRLWDAIATGDSSRPALVEVLGVDVDRVLADATIEQLLEAVTS